MPAERPHGRPLGVVYTPREVAEPMVRVALAPLIAGRTAAELLALRVCDPAIGEGAFLVEVVRVIAEALRAAWQREGTARDDAEHAVASHCIAGVDIDPRAVEIARQTVGCTTLRVGDALALDWDGGFDAVVGNPPYIRQEQLAAHKPALAAFEVYDGVADLYVYFVELAHRLLRPGGRYCLITPNKWLTAAYGRPLRTFLAARGSVEGLVDLSCAPVFRDADAFACIVWGRTGPPLATPIHAARIAPGRSVAAALADAAHPQQRARWHAEPWHVDAPDDRALIDRLERTWPTLGSLVGRPTRGVVTGYNRAFVIDRERRAQLLADDPACAAWIRPFVKGRDLGRWHARPGERFVLLVDRGSTPPAAITAHLAQFRPALEPRTPGAAIGRKPGRYRWYELQDPVGALAASPAPRLLYQDIQAGPACCLDDQALVPDTTVWMLPTDDRYLLAILNSPLYGWYARRRFPPALGGAVRPKLAYIRALPIATPAPDLRRHIVGLVDRQLARDGDPAALDDALADAVGEAYALSRDERQLAIGS